ncbi:unnamed protein product [Ceutorhynchus assimilis]|uniref:Uncharacterized protein n=1 Tax=Ceutorhynchus assimilis TaxID=467358 RepID=A0A9P0GP77_9CUCU|nr:unnamed protein product [Ceutorhynchus assimilis]
MFTEQATSKEFKFKRVERGETSSKRMFYEEHDRGFAKRPNIKDLNYACGASDFYYSPRNSETIYEVPAIEEGKRVECIAALNCRKSNKMNNKLFICQIIVAFTCLMVSCINVYFLMQFKVSCESNLLPNPNIETRIKELEENGKSLKQYLKQMENSTKHLLDMVEPLQAYVCYNFNLTRAERKVLGCVTGLYK